jgi:DNA mismatch repair protein MutS2
MSDKTLELLEWPRLCQQVASFAATELGAIAAGQLAIPKTPAESQQLLTQTAEVITLEVDFFSPLRFEGVGNIRSGVERANRQGILAGEVLWAIATTLAAARGLRRSIDAHDSLTVLNELVADLRTYPELEQAICHCIDERGEVLDRASEALTDIRDRQRRGRAQIQAALQRILQRKASALQEQLITQRGDRSVLPVKAAQKDAVPGIVHDTSASGMTLYIEPQATVELNNQLRHLLRQEAVECEAIRQRLSLQVAAAYPDLMHLIDVVTALDLAAARARYSLKLNAHCPTWVAQEQGVQLRQLHHPLLMWKALHAPPSTEQPTVVPIDLVIQPQTRVVAITGPNTGGKTVTLKTLGLAILMAKTGLFVPAKLPIELPWFDQVLADIGDEQSIEQSLSTFSGHIRRIQAILSALTPNSLVLLDEVGAGTDPQEGTALAIALLESLAESAQLTMATTHFGELKTLKYQDERFENASVEFDDATLRPTYRLLWGIPGRSNALIIAERLGLDSEILAKAQQRLEGAADDFNQVIASLEQQRRTQEDKAQDAAKLLARAETLHQQIERRAESLRLREQELRQQQTQQLALAFAEAKAEIAQVIRKLQQGPQTARAARQATQSLEAIAQVRQPPPPPQPVGFMPQVGDRIRIPSLGQTAEVIAPVTEAGEVTVRMGFMKMTVAMETIESLQGEKVVRPTPPPPPAPPVAAPALEIRTSQNTVDLRGQRVSDAEVVLENAIAQAQGPLWIIHGHGTGKLRLGVQAFLKQHPQVERFEFAEQSDGGQGVTIAYCRYR